MGVVVMVAGRGSTGENATHANPPRVCLVQPEGVVANVESERAHRQPSEFWQLQNFCPEFADDLIQSFVEFN